MDGHHFYTPDEDLQFLEKVMDNIDIKFSYFGFLLCTQAYLRFFAHSGLE